MICLDVVTSMVQSRDRFIRRIAWGGTETILWASYQIRKIAGAHAPGIPGTFSPSPQVSDPDTHHSTCVTHVPWCMPGSLTSGFLWNRRRGERSRHSRLMRNLQFYVSGKRPMEDMEDTEHPQTTTEHNTLQTMDIHFGGVFCCVYCIQFLVTHQWLINMTHAIDWITLYILKTCVYH